MSDPAASSVPIDLSRLPAPAVVRTLAFETVLAEIVADFRARLPGFDALVESDPALKLMEAFTYRELLLRGGINDAARAVMLAYAGGSDLDHLAAFFGVRRLVIMPATLTDPAVLEDDADLRTRIQLAPEQLPHAGRTAGSYRALALATVPGLKDVAVIKRGGGRLDVVLLGRAGDGTVAPADVSAVAAALADDGATQLTDAVTVQAATILPYALGIRVRIRFGPDAGLVRAEVEKAVRAHAADRHRVGYPVYAQMLEAAASVGGVEQAIADIADVVPGPAAAAWLSALTVTVEPVA